MRKNRRQISNRLTSLKRRNDSAQSGRTLNDKGALNRAIRLLARRDHSIKELRERLEPYYVESSVIWAISEVERMGYLKSPDDLARLWSRSLDRRGKSHRQIQEKLRDLGLPATKKDAESEEQKCREVLARRFGEVKKPDYNQKAKIYRFLAYRGFDSDIINKVLRENERS